MSRKIDLKDFAMRVERLCNFFIAQGTAQTGRDGSDDLRVLEDLKEEAADIQFDRVQIVSGSLQGLSDFMRGFPEEKNEKEK